MNLEKQPGVAPSDPPETAVSVAGQYPFKTVQWPLLYVLLATAFLSLWHTRVAHGFSVEALLVFGVFCGASLACGRSFFRVAAFCIDFTPGFSAQFLCGYFILNTAGFILSFVTHLTIAAVMIILCACSFLSLFFSGRKNAASGVADRLPDFICLFLAGLGATLWCTDSLTPIVGNSQVVIFRMWNDCFFHSREISTFAQAHGLANCSNIQMSGVQATIYHYASYVMPAAVSSLTGVASYRVMAGFLVPFGILLSGLGAFTLISAVRGAWPGLAAVVAVILLPDAYQQGFQNKFMGYHFLQQVGPTGLYGVSISALAWAFMLSACKSGKWPAIFFAYGIVLVSVAYKAQIFVANAYLIMIYPCFFFRPVKVPWRVIIGAALTVLFVSIVTFSQKSAAVPILRLDGSGARQYAHLVLVSFDPGYWRYFYFLKLTGEVPPAFHLIMASMIIMTTFGLWFVACLVFFFTPKARTDEAVRLFPILIIVNYLVMAVGLAIETKHIGMPEEFLHRPLVWAYFAVTACTGAAIYVCVIGNGPPKRIAARIATGVFVLLCLAFPFKFGHNIQTMPMWPGWGSFPEFNRLPTAFFQAAAWIRSRSPVTDIIQDSENDPGYWLTALAEREDFVSYNPLIEIRLPSGLHERVVALEDFKKMTNPVEITAFARERKISWYLLNPQTKVTWPDSFLKTAVFESQGYRLFHFTE